MTIEIVDFPIKNGGSFHSYVKLPEGIWLMVIPSIIRIPKFHGYYKSHPEPLDD